MCVSFLVFFRSRVFTHTHTHTSYLLQALLILNKEMETNTQIGMSCLPKYQESAQSLANRKCFVTSLEYVNGRYDKFHYNRHLTASRPAVPPTRSVSLFLYLLTQTAIISTVFHFFFFRLIERTETIKIFEVDRCRDIFNHQNRLQIFFPKQNICAGHSNGQSIKIVSKRNPNTDPFHWCNHRWLFHYLLLKKKRRCDHFFMIDLQKLLSI